MNRRDFILDACRACAALAMLPATAALEGCASSAKGMAVSNGRLEVPVETLGREGRAVVKAAGLAHPLLLVRRADGSCAALELNCPHKNGPLKEKQGRLVCAWHGSTFDLEGRLLKGPSTIGLKTYPVEADGEVLRVKLS